MRKVILLLKFLTLIFTSTTAYPMESEIPWSARITIEHDYSEWVHPMRLTGSCELLPVIQVEWLTPWGVIGKRPVVWLKVNGKVGAILGLTEAQAEQVSGIVEAQPLMMLRDVPIYRLCSHEALVTPW